jgi:hypothetical protein
MDIGYVIFRIGSAALKERASLFYTRSLEL